MTLTNGAWLLTIPDNRIEGWEIAFSQSHLNQKLDGDMAEIIYSDQSQWTQLWLWFQWFMKKLKT